MSGSVKTLALSLCPCGSGKLYPDCCGHFHAGALPDNAVALMRSRYSAYVLRDETYLQATWHADTRPLEALLPNGDHVKWLGLEVLRDSQNGDAATVEFVARYKLGGRARRLHEVSHFVRVEGRWLYVDGGFPEQGEVA
ncbi:MAG: YchJ family metal-binding protein [Herbaspirillum sp.]